ncbi:beta-galactosidase [Paenibacillus sp. UNCCL117]|uniref:glycoside hydrolase family 2 protein n=1 Tax=unclassified Paenibacillus TaxID=185978 RepID=UPI00088B0C5D|nr:MULTISPECIES: glycoside hydrolase family 2 TIM barrel-domain containing protein [unclassified Paenibacillus]SDD04491.1 beta-galactosidase [Paenibacillus sp. cl123]SFW32068.1 beta-galactosidase [Paenibacillus sp. UNCCL117]
MPHTIPLKDCWMFTKENRSSYASEAMEEGQPVALPHTWNDKDGQGGSEPYYRGACWYQTKLAFTAEDLEKHRYLEIGAAGNIGHVYVNGHLAGESRCGYAMFRVPLSPYLRAGDNLISIRVDNSYDNEVYPLLADFTFFGGLYREVKLLVMEDIHFDVMDKGRDGVYLTQHPCGGGDFQLDVHGCVVNESSRAVQAFVKVQLRDQEGTAVWEDHTEVALTGEAGFAFQGQVSSPVLWNGVEQPYLYNAVITVSVEGRVLDSRQIDIGFRTVELTSDRGVILNGKPMPINGVCRHQDFGGVGNAITREHMELDMDIIREVGANSIRLAHYQHDDYFYSLCDRYGLLVWAEIPYISIPSTKDPESRNAFEQLERLIKQAYNHSSIYCWGVQNEITIAVETENTYRTIQSLVEAARRLDASRFVAQANINGVADDSVINGFTDLVGYNLYYGWYYGEIKDLGTRLDEFHRTRPDVPVLVSEYGVDTNPAYHSYTPQVQDYTEEYQLMFHHNALETFRERPFVLGGYVWNMFDFGSANRNEGGEKGKNLKGLVTIDRALRKDAFYLCKAYWSKEPFVHLAGRRFVRRHRERNDIVILSNMDHIRVYHNDVLLAEMRGGQRVFQVKDAALVQGDNRIRAEGIRGESVVHTDEMLLTLSAEADPGYIHVKEEKAKHVVNWFENFDLSGGGQIELKDGYFSIYDTIEDLYSHAEAKAVFLKYFGHTTNNPFFEVTQGVMSIEKMSQLAFYEIPAELLPVIQNELNIIRK